MEINLPDYIIQSLKNKNFRSVIKILEIHGKSSLISVLGKKIEIPYVLNPNHKYILINKNGVIEIKEKKSVDINEVLKEFKIITEEHSTEFKINEKNQKLFENLIKNFPFFEIYSKINNDLENRKNRNKNSVRNKNKNEYLFVYTIPFYYKLTHFFIKITNINNVYLGIYTGNVEIKQINNFTKCIAGKLDSKINLIVKIFDNSEEFYNSILIHANEINIDIEV